MLSRERQLFVRVKCALRNLHFHFLAWTITRVSTVKEVAQAPSRFAFTRTPYDDCQDDRKVAFEFTLKRNRNYRYQANQSSRPYFMACTERVNFISWTLLKLQHPILIERMRNSKSDRFTDTVSAFHFWFHVEKKDIVIIVRKMIIADSQMIAIVIIPMIINVTINSYNILCNTNCGNTLHGVRFPNENRNIYLFVVIGSYIIVKYLLNY